MPFAHTASSSGPNTEILLLGTGMIVLAVVFFFQRSASRRASVVLLVLGAAAVTGAFTLASSSGNSGSVDHHEVSITITSPAEGASVEASAPVPFEIELEGATLAAESNAEDAGHLHVYVDGSVVDMPSSLDLAVDLEPGEHQVEVEYVDSEHQALDPPVVDSIEVRAE